MVWLISSFFSWSGDGFAEEDIVFPSSVLMAREQSVELDLLQRVEYISESMLGIPYLLDPEGEEEGLDRDPLLRFDKMDCLTYVEAVLALSMTDSTDSALSLRNELRYLDTEVAYEKRKHFMFTQWIPSNIELGFFSDITSQIGKTKQVEKEYHSYLEVLEGKEQNTFK